MTGVFVEMLSSQLAFFVFEDQYTEDIFKYDLIKFKNLEEFTIKYTYMQENRQDLDKLYSYFNCALNDDDLITNYTNSIANILKSKMILDFKRVAI